MNAELPAYRSRDMFRELRVDELMKRFRDAERFIAFCRRCPAYGRTWACPPFDYDTEMWLRGWDDAVVVATVIEPAEAGVAQEFARPLMNSERVRMATVLRGVIDASGREGVALGAFGGCDRCPSGECTRPYGEPCRYPEASRPSLEALGFDVEAIMRELFGQRLQWPEDGKLPTRLTMVSAVFTRDA